MPDNIYFNCTAGSPAAKLFANWQASIVTHRCWIRRFVRRHKLGKVEWVGLNGISVVGFAPTIKTPCSWSESEAQWNAYMQAHPLWRRQKSRRGSDYLVPRKDSVDGKKLAKEWADRPRPTDGENLGHEVTGVHSFMDWMQGMRLFNAGWRCRDDGSVLLVVPYHVTKAKSWKPLEGVTRGDQDALREEWNEKNKDD